MSPRLQSNPHSTSLFVSSSPRPLHFQSDVELRQRIVRRRIRRSRGLGVPATRRGAGRHRGARLPHRVVPVVARPGQQQKLWLRAVRRRHPLASYAQLLALCAPLRLLYQLRRASPITTGSSCPRWRRHGRGCRSLRRGLHATSGSGRGRGWLQGGASRAKSPRASVDPEDQLLATILRRSLTTAETNARWLRRKNTKALGLAFEQSER